MKRNIERQAFSLGQSTVPKSLRFAYVQALRAGTAVLQGANNLASPVVAKHQLGHLMRKP